uniref:Uncharacterized protein n=1 Tax=Arundo donax TaxID=35708 RepID=A0A0A9C8D4_ARUDO
MPPNQAPTDLTVLSRIINNTKHMHQARNGTKNLKLQHQHPTK